VEQPVLTARASAAAWNRVLSWLAPAAALLLAACATAPHTPAQGEPAAAGKGLQAKRAAERAAIKQPLDATRLPPFNGETKVVHEPLRGVPKIDRTIPPDDLWERIRDGFALPDLDNAEVADQTAWYAARPEYLERMFARSHLYLYHVVAQLEKRGMPTELALLPMVESAYNPMAYSRAHASGLWQFIPPTGKRYALKQNWWYDGRRDIIASTSAALDYLEDLYQMFGDWDLALAAYNCGENTVARAIARNKARGLPIDYSSLDLPEQTREYVPKLQALKNIISNPGIFGITLDPIPNAPYFTTVATPENLDVRLAAKLAEMPVDEFIALNPGLNRPLMPASEVRRIVLPADRVDVYRANLTKYDEKAMVSWRTYHPRRGERLDRIARQFHVSLADLKRVNGIPRYSDRTPPLLVVPIDGAAARHAGQLPIMYAPPIPAGPVHFIVHTVRSGESLWSIARHYRVTVKDLERWNHVGRNLRIGTELRIYTRFAAAHHSSRRRRSETASHRTGGRKIE
jgi:peptidoglycan lytic transglycosylase D